MLSQSYDCYGNHMLFGEPFGGLIPGARGAVLAALLRTDSPLTGRQLHGLLSDDHSLWSVQEALRMLDQIGLVKSQTVGRAGVHTINDDHVAIAALRALVDPIAALTTVVERAVGEDVQAVLLFGSIARGEATPDSDVDLAVIAAPEWDGQILLEEAVRQQLGNACDVVAFTPVEFTRLARDGEPVVSDILRYGVALVGNKPHVQRGAA
jgi:predicted nucleotidyltransferase